MRWIYISPHLDDAVLSAGGFLYEQARAGADVEIWTILAGFPPDEISPFAQILHQQWGVTAAVDLINTRRAEDLNAACIVGAKVVHFNFLDCIYRRGKNGNWLYTDIFVLPHVDEAELPTQIAESISARLTPDAKLICQFGIGSHVDHILVRHAVELLDRPLFYTADVPYLFRTPEQLAPQTIGIQENTHRITESALGAWQDAIGEYKSQIGSLFENPADMRLKIQKYSAENSGIRIWSSG